jgi:hypothetical protein
MATLAMGGSDRSVSIGRVFSRAFGTIGSNPIATLGISFLFGALPALGAATLLQSATAQELGVIGSLGVMLVGLGSIVVSIVLAAVTQGALVRATVAHSQGGTAGFAESAMAGLSMVVPLFIVALLSALGIGLGFALFLVPGVMLYCMWAVCAPALVEERLGPIEALRRSRYLTKGARWKVFGLVLVVLISYWLFLGLIGVFSTAVFGEAAIGEAGFLNRSAGQLAVSAIMQTLSSAVWSVVLASLYVELREWKDGPAADALAEIFG